MDTPSAATAGLDRARGQLLDRLDREILLVLALAEDRLSLADWTRALDESGLRTPGGLRVSRQGLDARISVYAKFALFEQSEDHSGASSYSMRPQSAVAYIRACLADDLGGDILARMPPGASGRGSALGHCLAFRIAVARCDWPRAKHTLVELAGELQTQGWYARTLAQMLGCEPELAWLDLLDPPALRVYAREVVQAHLWRFEALSAPVLGRLASEADAATKLDIAHVYALRGEFERAREVAGLDRGRELAGALYAAFWARQHADVVRLGRVMMAARGQKKYPHLPDVDGLYFAISAMIESAGDEELRARVHGLIASAREARVGRRLEYGILSIWAASERAAGKAGPGGPELWTGCDLATRRESAGWLAAFIEGLTRQWSQSDALSAEALLDLERLAEDAFTGKATMLARECRALVGAARGEACEAGALATAHRPPPRWQLVLDAMRALAQPGSTATTTGVAGATQLLWRLQLGQDEFRITPRIVAAGRSPEGQPVGVATLLNARPNYLCPADDRVLAVVDRAAGPRSRGRRDCVLGPDALVALIGHPRVCDAGGRVLQVEAGEPELRVRELDEAQLQLEVWPPELQSKPIAWRRVDQTRVVVYAASARWLELVQTMGQGVLQVPEQGWPQLSATLVELGAALRVTGTGLAAELGEQMPACSDLAVHLHWNTELLELRVVCLPLGESGPSVTAGVGASGVFASIEGRLLSTRRDLPGERALLGKLLACCPLLQAAEIEPGRYRSRDMVSALELLSEAQAAGVPLVWNSRQKLGRIQTKSSRDMRGRISRCRDWLQFAVGLQVDETRVIELGKLLAARIGSSRFIRISNAEIIALSDTLAAGLSDLQCVAAIDESGARVPMAALPVAAEIADALGPVELGRRATKALARAHKARDAEICVPEGLACVLRAYQYEGFAWLARLARLRSGACLADDMGLGKTVQTLAILCRRARRGPALVVAPASVAGNWLAETRRFAPELEVADLRIGPRAPRLQQLGPGQVLVCSYGIMVREIEALRALEFSTVVFDEAQALKNAKARRSKAAAALQAGFRVALTGTPVENRVDELWSLMRVIVPGLLGSRKNFELRFGAPIRGGDARALADLKTRIAPFVLRRHKADVLAELPELEHVVLRVAPSGRQRDFYEALRRRAVESLRSASEDGRNAGMVVLAEITRLRRAAIDPRMVDEDCGIEGAKIPALLARLEQLSAEGHRALVFTQFKASAQLVCDGLQDLGISYLHFDGSTPSEQRAQSIEQFQAGAASVFVISLRAGGTGINLTLADYVFHLDPWWNPAVEDQATARAHRMGQTRRVTAYRLVTSGTIEDQVLQLHHEKRALASSLIDDLDGVESLGLSELKALLTGG